MRAQTIATWISVGWICGACGPSAAGQPAAGPSRLPPSHTTAEAEADPPSPPETPKTLRGSAEAPHSDAGWFPIANASLAAVEVDRCLYEHSTDKQFHVRIRIQNLTDNTVGVDLRDHDLAPYPNQWGGLNQPERTIIDESRLSLGDQSDTLATQAVAGLRANALEELPSKHWLEFYRPFNAGEAADVKALDSADTPHLFISFDGVVPVAVSTVAEVIPIEASLILDLPACWGNIPADAWILPH